MEAKQTGGHDAHLPGPIGLWSLLLSSIFPMLGLFALGPALPRVAAAFSADPNAEVLAQLIGGASGISFALSSPIIGGMIGRWGYKPVYVVSLLAFAAFGTVPALLHSLPLILLTRVLLGVCVAGAFTAGLAGIGTLDATQRPRMYGRNAMLSSVGAMAIFPAVGALSTIGWRLPFLIHLIALAVVPMAMTLPSKPVATAQAHAHAHAPTGHGLGVAPVLLVLAAFMGLAMYVGPMFAPFYLKTIGVTDPRLAALPLSGMSLAALIVTGNFGRLYARFGARTLFAATLVLTGLGLLAAGLAPSLPAFAAAMFVVSGGLAMFAPNVSAHIAATSTNFARGIGLAMSAMFAVQVAFPFLARAISQAVGPASVFHIFGGCALVAGIGTVALARRTIRPAARTA
ncbi:MFS transporter [Novosphingobium lentum]|uniref:MFS transporter n=1 Tax=Novosphingobium lentum TaxID=145287 RepID=UPI001470277A|nr:MFS transporter [Novosphingobium lentum]